MHMLIHALVQIRRILCCMISACRRSKQPDSIQLRRHSWRLGRKDVATLQRQGVRACHVRRSLLQRKQRTSGWSAVLYVRYQGKKTYNFTFYMNLPLRVHSPKFNFPNGNKVVNVDISKCWYFWKLSTCSSRQVSLNAACPEAKVTS